MKRTLFFTFSTILLFVSCNNYTGELRTIKQGGFELQLPDWLEETNDLAAHATYQFKSRYRNTYGIVVKNAKENLSFESYQENAIKILRNFKELSNLLVIDSTETDSSIHFELMGDIESEKIYYWHNCYETSAYYYQLVLWTRSYDRKQKYTPTIKTIIESFKCN